MRPFAQITWLLVAVSLTASCRPLTSGSYLKNIYEQDDTDPSRRHEASLFEANWTIHANGCSGVLLSPTLIMTAHHCQLKVGTKIQSGWSVMTGGGADILATNVLEDNATLDYMIVQVRWLNMMPSSQTFPPYVARDSSEIFNSQVKDQGDEIFTVGFPDDKAKVWKSTYAEGQIKYLKGQKLYFNIGVINGNSGGGILKKENNMLVGLTIGGTKGYQEAGWNNNSADDSENWNYGTATWAIYPVSPTLQKQFPNGRNIYFGETFFPRTKIYLSIQKDTKGNELKVAASLEATALYLCPADAYPCTPTTSGAEALTFDLSASGRRFYSRQKALVATDMKKLGLVAYDKDGKLIGQRQVAVEGAP